MKSYELPAHETNLSSQQSLNANEILWKGHKIKYSMIISCSIERSSRSHEES